MTKAPPANPFLRRRQLLYRLALSLGGFSLLGEVEGSQADYEHQSNSRRDNSVSLRGGVRYALTDRLAAGASCTWTTQDSDVSALNYERTLVSGHLSCRF